VHCPNCGAENRDDAAFCGNCRSTLGQNASAGGGWATPFVDHQTFDHDMSAGDVPYAGFWDRFFALVLDSLFSLLLAAIPAVLLAVLLQDSGVALLAGLLAWSAGVFAYHIGFTAYGGGLGMRIMGIRIVRAEDGARPGFGRAFVRLFARGVFGIVPVLGSVLPMVDGLWMIKDPHKQTWHDKAARTYVVER